LSYRPSYRFEYRYRVLPSSQILELALEHYSREKADEHFPQEAWIQHPGPLPRKRRNNPRAGFHLSWDDLEILSVNQVPLGERPYFRFSREALSIKQRRPNKERTGPPPITSQQFRTRYQQLRPFIDKWASVLAKHDPDLRSELVQEALIIIGFETSNDPGTLKNVTLRAMRSARKKYERQFPKKLDLPENL
jgi:hypothetical protein